MALLLSLRPNAPCAGASGWHTHAGDYAVESLEPHCMFRVLRDGRHLALASVAADGQLLCGAGGGDSLGLAACNPGAWVNSGAAWEHRDGAIYSCRWQEKVGDGHTHEGRAMLSG